MKQCHKHKLKHIQSQNSKQTNWSQWIAKRQPTKPLRPQRWSDMLQMRRTRPYESRMQKKSILQPLQKIQSRLKSMQETT